MRSSAAWVWPSKRSTSTGVVFEARIKPKPSGQSTRTPSIVDNLAPTLIASRITLPPEGAALAWGGPARRAGREKSAALVQVLPEWQVQGFFGERIYALRPWSPQVPKAVQCLVEHLRESFAGGFVT